jgi:hypothetical protein
MLDSQGNNKGYLTKDDWVYAITMLPIQHPLYSDDNHAKQTFYALIEVGRLIEIEPGKYKLNTTQEEKGEQDRSLCFSVRYLWS